ncbi:MAG: Do family serine endopeptidase [Planctomycetaceae bacterium]|nr:Do family serine endopeptidase [Planctomycetales bacterium]MCB9941724.1 Do family serine endopeptidase [Planctomycetaceae bacterium]
MKTLSAGAIAAILFAVGAAAVTQANNRQASVSPVTYRTKSAPNVTPAEAERAVSSAKDLSTAFRVASERVLPAVVTIENMPKAVAVSDKPAMPQQPNQFGDRNPFEGTPFEDFFKDRGFKFETPHMQPQPHGGGMGSGVVIDPSGIILTNNHVVAGDGEVTVRLHDEREFKAINVWTDPKTDIAVVKIDAKDLVAAKLGDSDLVSVGDWVLALGQPFGLEDTVTAGIISAKHRGIGITSRESFLQTDAAINPGNSGGPLVNLDGEVIGINTAISSRTGGNDGIGFAVPVNLAKWVGDQLANGGTVHRAYLGVGIQPVTAALADQFKVKPREGVAVTDVFPNTPAAKAGLQAGDVITEYAGVAVSSPSELQLLVERSELGRSHQLVVVRDGKRINLNFIPEAQPNDFGTTAVSPGSSPAKPESSEMDELGMEVSSLDATVAEQLGMKGIEGVVITNVRSGGPADLAGLSSGMVITQVNRHAVKSLDEFTAAVKKAETSDGLLLLVRSQEGSRFVVVK